MIWEFGNLKVRKTSALYCVVDKHSTWTDEKWDCVYKLYNNMMKTDKFLEVPVSVWQFYKEYVEGEKVVT